MNERTLAPSLGSVLPACAPAIQESAVVDAAKSARQLKASNDPIGLDFIDPPHRAGRRSGAVARLARARSTSRAASWFGAAETRRWLRADRRTPSGPSPDGLGAAVLSFPPPPDVHERA